MTTKIKSKGWQERFDKSTNDYNNLKIDKLVSLDLSKSITENNLIYLGGFVEGEGSININIRRSPTARFGMFVDLEFGLYQSNRNIQHLFTLCRYLKAGTVYVGTLKTLDLDPTNHSNYEKASFRVGSRQELIEKVIPFIKKYVIPHAGPFYKNRFERWSKALDLFEKQVHLSAVGLYNEMIPRVVELKAITPRKDAGEKLATLDELRTFLINTLKEKFQKDEIDYAGLNPSQICEKFDKLFPPQKGGRN